MSRKYIQNLRPVYRVEDYVIPNKNVIQKSITNQNDPTQKEKIAEVTSTSNNEFIRDKIKLDSMIPKENGKKRISKQNETDKTEQIHRENKFNNVDKQIVTNGMIPKKNYTARSKMEQYEQIDDKIKTTSKKNGTQETIISKQNKTDETQNNTDQIIETGDNPVQYNYMILNKSRRQKCLVPKRHKSYITDQTSDHANTFGYSIRNDKLQTNSMIKEHVIYSKILDIPQMKTDLNDYFNSTDSNKFTFATKPTEEDNLNSTETIASTSFNSDSANSEEISVTDNNNIADSACIAECSNSKDVAGRNSKHSDDHSDKKKRGNKFNEKPDAYHRLQDLEARQVQNENTRTVPKIIIKQIYRTKRPILRDNNSDKNLLEQDSPTLVIENLHGTPRSSLRKRKRNQPDDNSTEGKVSEPKATDNVHTGKRGRKKKGQATQNEMDAGPSTSGLQNQVPNNNVKETQPKNNQATKRTLRNTNVNSNAGAGVTIASNTRTRGRGRASVNTVQTESVAVQQIIRRTRQPKRRQVISDSDEDIVYFPENALDECVALTDERLLIYPSDESSPKAVQLGVPSLKVTSFAIYDETARLCPLDSKLIETNVLLLFSGYLQPVYEEDPSIRNGVVVANAGPIAEWWITGYEADEKAVIGFSTDTADYYLMKPSDQYAPYMYSLVDKVNICKKILEYLTENGWRNPKYEDLINYLLRIELPPQYPSVTEERILSYANFICEQVNNYDLVDENEDMLIATDCMITLCELSGTNFVSEKTELSVRRGTVGRKRTGTLAEGTNTELVARIFENFFHVEKHTWTFNNKHRCGLCRFCKASDCGKCTICRQMPKFGGMSTNRQLCVRRRCPNVAIKDALAVEDDSTEEQVSVPYVPRLRSSEKCVDVIFMDSILRKGIKCYKLAITATEEYHPGEFYLMNPEYVGERGHIVKALYFFQSDDKHLFHGQVFCYGDTTILGDTANIHEIFLTDKCANFKISCIDKKLRVSYKHSTLPPKPKSPSRGKTRVKKDTTPNYFCNFRYTAEPCRFQEAPDAVEQKDYFPCILCNENEKKLLFETPMFKDGNITWKGELYTPGTGIYLEPNLFGGVRMFPLVPPPVIQTNYDDSIFPEKYRKTSEIVQGSNVGTPDPFCIGVILSIEDRKSKDGDIELIIRKMFRPHHYSRVNILQDELNKLYWSSEIMRINFANVLGRCYVEHIDDLMMSTEVWFASGPDRFYYELGFDPHERKMYELHESEDIFDEYMKDRMDETRQKVEKPTVWETLPRPLRAMDVFAGAGGLSTGLHNSGLSETLWAIESDPGAARAFKINNPGTTVFTENCNIILKLAIDGKFEIQDGKRIPKPGDVELLCGGPPCQGFSGMNRFQDGVYSSFRNSLVSTYLSYCDFYRPRYFLMENVRNLVMFKRGMVLKLALRALLEMGYQCSFAVLQAGHYGVPQSRRRLILLASLPGFNLPNFPEPTHVFSPRVSHLTVVIDGKRYKNGLKWLLSAPLRTITVNDAISDLPVIDSGDLVITPDRRANLRVSHYNRLLQGYGQPRVLYDHICKELAPIVKARIRKIPTAVGSDWRDLPNLPFFFGERASAKVLKYDYMDIKNGRSKTGKYRGVCPCVSGEKCIPSVRQPNTFIPWCLVHTANKYNNWAGLYGRLDPLGFFSTTVTIPEPMAKQGRVLHPTQDRVVSVRECARSQGFPDRYCFMGTVLDKYKQIGNAVPPPLGVAIGREIIKSINTKPR